MKGGFVFDSSSFAAERSFCLVTLDRYLQYDNKLYDSTNYITTVLQCMSYGNIIIFNLIFAFLIPSLDYLSEKSILVVLVATAVPLSDYRQELFP